MEKHVIKKTNFNPLYDELTKWVGNPSIRQIGVYGGTSAAKTFSIVQYLFLDGYNKSYNSIVFKKESTTIDSTVYKDFITIKDKFKLSNKFHFIKHLIRYKKNEIKFAGMDDPEKVKGLSSYLRIYINELSKFFKEDYDETLDRMRGVPGQQLIWDMNPISEHHWVKTKILDKEEWTELPTSLQGENSSTHINKSGDFVLIKTTYLDNKWVVGPKFVDTHTLERFEYNKLHNPNRYRVNAKGEWGVEENENAWLFAFTREAHVYKDLPFYPSFPVHLSFDFNKDPLTCSAWQHSPVKGNKESFIHCIKTFGGKKTLSQLCLEIKTAYPFSILYVTGDRSGNEEGSIVADSLHESAYKLIQAHLGLSKKQMHLNMHNASHESSRYLCNAMLQQYPNIKINADCIELITDCEIAKPDPKGKPHQLYKDRGVYKMDYFDGLRYFFQQYYTDFAKSNYFTQ
jgi:phage terminase large subunit